MEVALKGFKEVPDKQKITFRDEFGLELLCQLCNCLPFQVIRDAKLHGFCGACYKMMVNPDGIFVCNVDNKKYAQDQIFVDDILPIVKDLRVTCPKKCSDTTMTFAKLLGHYNNCGQMKFPPNQPVRQGSAPLPTELLSCPLCQVKIIQANLIQHCKEECSERIVQCGHCNVDIKAGNEEEHKTKCDMRPVPCTECGQYISFQENLADKLQTFELEQQNIKKMCSELLTVQNELQKTVRLQKNALDELKTENQCIKKEMSDLVDQYLEVHNEQIALKASRENLKK